MDTDLTRQQLLAMRYNDVIDGTKTFDEVLPKYQAAWAKENGFVGENGLFRRFYRCKQEKDETNNVKRQRVFS